MKIMLLNNSHLPVIGGKEIVVHHLAMSYLKLGHDVVVVGPGGYRRNFKYKYPYKMYRWPRIPFLSKEATWRLLLRIAHFRFKCDVIHAHTTYPNGYTAAELKDRFGYPLIITPHGEDIHKVPEIKFGDRLDPRTDDKIQYALGKSTYCTAISDAVASSLEDAGVPKGKIVPISNGVDIERFSQPVKIDVLGHFGFPQDTKLVVSVGNYHLRKGHEVLVDAVAKARKTDKHIKLVIVGNTAREFCEKVETMGMGDYVKFSGILNFPMPGSSDNSDLLVAMLHKSVAYITSSIAQGTEGLSLALLEAMAAGTCVISTNVSGSRDVIENLKNGLLVEPNSVQEMAQAILTICDDETLRNNLAREGKKFVDHFSWLSVARQYCELFYKSRQIKL